MKLNKLNELRLKFVMYVAFSLTVSLLPLAIAVAINWHKYTGYTVGGAVKLGAGALIGVAFIALKVIGKLKMPRRIILFAIVCVTSYLLEPLLYDLTLLSGMALVGEFCDLLLCQTAIAKIKQEIALEKTSDATASKVEEIIKKYASEENDDERQA